MARYGRRSYRVLNYVLVLGAVVDYVSKLVVGNGSGTRLHQCFGRVLAIDNISVPARCRAVTAIRMCDK